MSKENEKSEKCDCRLRTPLQRKQQQHEVAKIVMSRYVVCVTRFYLPKTKRLLLKDDSQLFMSVVVVVAITDSDWWGRTLIKVVPRKENIEAQLSSLSIQLVRLNALPSFFSLVFRLIEGQLRQTRKEDCVCLSISNHLHLLDVLKLPLIRHRLSNSSSVFSLLPIGLLQTYIWLANGQINLNLHLSVPSIVNLQD